MAKYIPKLPSVGITANLGTGATNLVTDLSKVQRLKILYDQQMPNRPKVDRTGGPLAYEFEPTTPTTQSSLKKHRTYIRPTPDGYVSEPPQTKVRLNRDNDYESVVLEQEVVSIIDIDFIEENHKDTRKTNSITLPFVPRELNYQPTSNFVGIASFGRNNPFYQFTGSEDSLTFEIDWFAKEVNREDVIAKCRWLEALTKGDGFDDIPHRVMLVWGSSNKLFQDDVWIVTAAPYNLSQFQRAFRDRADGEVKSLYLLPQQAVQTVVLKKVTKDNLSSKRIIGNLGWP